MRRDNPRLRHCRHLCRRRCPHETQTRLQNRDYYHVTMMRQNHEIHLRLEYFVDVSKQYVEWLLFYGLKSHLDLRILILKPSRLPQVSYIINLDVVVPWRIVWVCLDRQDATSQAPLMLAKGEPVGGFGNY